MKSMYLKFTLFILLCATQSTNSSENTNDLYYKIPNQLSIHEHGYWCGKETGEEHLFDPSLANALVVFFNKEKAKNLADFGCGEGDYIKTFLNNQIDCCGYDGNPYTSELTEGLAEVLDLSQSFDLGKRFDWILSLEVGEHIPKEYEEIFFHNLDRHNTKGIVLSWAVLGQGGFGHFNTQNNDYIKTKMEQYGYSIDIAAENELRNSSSLSWFKNTIMVFRKATSTKLNLEE